MQRTQQNIGESNRTSVKVHHAPGGGSNFSLAWGNAPQEPQNHGGRRRINNDRRNQSNAFGGLGHNHSLRTENNIGESGQTSVKVHNPPGGRDHFSLAHDPHAPIEGPPRSGKKKFNRDQYRGNEFFGGSVTNKGSGFRSENNIGETNQTSVKVHNPPGGRGHFSLAHDYGNQDDYSQNNARGRHRMPLRAHQPQGNYGNPHHHQQLNEVDYPDKNKNFKPSVRVHNPPGGRSNITFG